MLRAPLLPIRMRGLMLFKMSELEDAGNGVRGGGEEECVVWNIDCGIDSNV